MKEDSEEIWNIFQEIISVGDKYPFPPDTSKEFCDDYFLSTGTLSFVAKDNQHVLGCYKIVPNQCGLASHVANATPRFKEKG